MRSRTLLVLLLTAALVPVVQPALAQGGSAAPVIQFEAGASPHSEVDKLYTLFSRAYDDLDAKAVAALYDEQAVYLAPELDILRGRAAIEATYTTFFGRAKENGGKVAISFRIVDRVVAPDMVSDVGYFDLTTTREGKSQTSRGKFTVVSRRQNDQWLYHVDSYSGIAQEKK